MATTASLFAAIESGDIDGDYSVSSTMTPAWHTDALSFGTTTGHRNAGGRARHSFRRLRRPDAWRSSSC